MTGPEPAAARQGSTPRALRRYRLARLFFNVYLLAMGSFVAIALLADFLVSTALKGLSEDYARKFMRGTIVMIEDELARHPRSNWPKVLGQLDDKFSYRLEIVDRQTLRLDPVQMAKLNAGEIAFDRERDLMYHRLRGGSSQVLAVGPLALGQMPEIEHFMPLDQRATLLTWGLTGFFFAIALWFWIRPVWRDLEVLRQTARALGDGRFEARATARSRVFGPLADTLNAMAERIQGLIATQKELSSAVSHELRTPIARLRFALEILAETEQRAERERLSQAMEGDLDELDALIDTSLTYARFERETPKPHFVETPIATWIEEIVDELRPLSRELAIRVDAGALPPGCRADLDRKWMPYALKNLLRNAFKYARSEIVVTPHLENDRMLIDVDDDGIGIPESEREKIFTAFTRLDRSRDRATGGYGLGLAITRRILGLHEGSVSVSTSPQGGARFTLSWPAHL